MTLLDRVLARRDALLGNARFRRWAAQFPPSRFIARRRARQLFDLCAGFVYSQTLLSCVRLELFDLLASSPLSTADIAARTALPTAAAERLLLAAEALGLVDRRSGQRWGLGSLGAPMVGNDPLAAMIEHNSLLYDDLRDPVALLRGGTGASRLSEYWAYAGAASPAEVTADAVDGYSTLMARSVALVAEEILARYPLAEHRVLLDVGGGEGAFLEAVARSAPGLALELVDLPPVAERARRRLSAAGLAARVTTHAVDFLRGPLPRGADLITLVRILHDHDDPAVLALLRACHRALPLGGKVLIAEPLAGGGGAAPRTGAVYFGFYLLAMGTGRARTAVEYGRMLEEVGFDKVRELASATPIQTGLVLGARLS